ncbi:MAG: histidinol-phosphate transaminase [Lachnospiraceae bacterium]|nr:histidinol-phosphate transaminase [Lachnospiraceae bacterium]
MSDFRDKIRRITPYVPGEQPKEKVIKLNTNENPYPPAPEVQKIKEAMDCGTLRMYPDPNGTTIRTALAEYHGVTPDQVFAGVGSDDVLATAFLTFFAGGEPILFPDITYSFYDVWADLFRIPYKTCPVGNDFRINLDDYKEPNGGVIIANPNAPTTIYEPVEWIEELVRNNSESVVIVDEAYIDFAPESALPLLKKYENLVIVRTYSKSRSMAGARLGYAIASKELIDAMYAVRNSYNSYTLTTLVEDMGAASLKDEAYFKETVGKVVATRERAKEKFRELGFICPDSQANFLFVSHPTVSAKKIFEELRERKIFVRFFNKPRINEYLRVTIGTDEEMDTLFKNLALIIKE